MPHPKFQLYKHIKISGKWRYCRAAIYSNGKLKPHVVVVGGQRSTKVGCSRKRSSAHPNDELSLLYGHADAKERFLLDFFISSTVRDHEGYGSRNNEPNGRAPDDP